MQQKVQAFLEAFQLQCPIESRYIDLVSEIGELGKEILQSTNYGKNDFAPRAALQEEMGDCLFSLLALCEALHLDSGSALQSVLDKYRKRLLEKGHAGSDAGTE